MAKKIQLLINQYYESGKQGHDRPDEILLSTEQVKPQYLGRQEMMQYKHCSHSPLVHLNLTETSLWPKPTGSQRAIKHIEAIHKSQPTRTWLVWKRAESRL